MEIKKIYIKNYQALNDLEIELVPGINLITGNSNNGKSAVIRAVRDLIFNGFQNSKIKHGEKELCVKLDDCIEAIRNKNTKYIIENKDYDKVGRVPLQEVKDLLKIGSFEVNKVKIEPNFQFQMDKPFLFDKTPGNKYELIIGTKQDKFLKALKKIKENSNELNKTDKKIIISRIDDLKKDKIILEKKHETLSVVEELYNSIKRINKEKKYIKEIESKINELDDIEIKIKKINENIEKILSLNLTKIETDLKNKSNNLDKIIELIFQYEKLEDKKKYIDESIKKINEMELLKINNGYIQDKKDELKEILGKINSFKETMAKGKKSLEELENVKKELKFVKEEFEQYKKEIKYCPVCGGIL